MLCWRDQSAFVRRLLLDKGRITPDPPHQLAGRRRLALLFISFSLKKGGGASIRGSGLVLEAKYVSKLHLLAC